MKKIIFTLLALVGTMSMNAQILKVMKGDKVVATFSAEEADNFVFEEAPAFPFGQGEAVATGIGNVKWIQLWENGPKFAEYNVGAASATEYGDFFEWSSTDIATTQWGSKWRMPKQAELQALLDNCNVEWKDNYNGTAGLLCTGKDAYSSNSVFLPAAGYCFDGDVNGQGDCGDYWSSTPNYGDYVYNLYFDSGHQNVYYDIRFSGCCVRAVLKETPATTGVAKATIGGSQVDVNWIQLWENGPKFAEYNVGAESATEYGGYYAWGGSQDKVDDHIDGEVALSGDTDTATKLWGSSWRMPTQAELQALLENCDVTWTDDYKGDNTNIKGSIFTGKGDYSSNSVFLPATGFCYHDNVDGQGDFALYWSSTPDGSDGAYYLYFYSGYQDVGSDGRGYGYSVRPVLK